MPTTSSKVILLVICALAGLATLCIGTLCICATKEIHVDSVIGTSLISLSGSLVGALGSLLVNTRSNHGTDDSSFPVTVQNSASQPVPTAEAKPKKTL